MWFLQKVFLFLRKVFLKVLFDGRVAFHLATTIPLTMIHSFHIDTSVHRVWLRKGFGFSGAWTVREQNGLLAVCFGLPQVNKV
jgi:hypothetical protein